MDYLSLLNKRGCKLLISGCSTSYNRHPYDPEPRMNATDCGVGMASWSFKLRDYIITSDPQFIYGKDIEFSCQSKLGLDNESNVPNTEVFDGKIKTLFPKEKTCFTVPLCGDEGVLYLQSRIDSPCRFDLEVDGKIVCTDISTEGSLENFAGYGLMQIVFKSNPDIKEHTICFKNIRGDNPKITVVGVGSRNIQINLSGKGSTTARFFIDNFDERIGNHKPDLLILTLGANDRVLNSPDTFRKDLNQLLSMIFETNPECKMLYILPPAGHNPNNPDIDCEGYTSKLTDEVYDRIIKNACNKFEIDTLAIRDVFDSVEVSQWRYDNIHMSRFGNEILLNAVLEKLKI